jgi:hypothetical protein
MNLSQYTWFYARCEAHALHSIDSHGIEICSTITKEINMAQDNEPNTWVSALKVIFGIAVMVGTIGFALWYASQQPEYSPALEQAIEVVNQKSANSASSSSKSWGIAKDSPVRK